LQLTSILEGSPSVSCVRLSYSPKYFPHLIHLKAISLIVFSVEMWMEKTASTYRG